MAEPSATFDEITKEPIQAVPFAKANGLVVSEKRGLQVYYRLARPAVLRIARAAGLAARRSRKGGE